MGNLSRYRHIAFWSDDSGAISVDWVVISAALIGLSVATISALRTEMTQMASSTAAFISTIGLGSDTGTPMSLVPDTPAYSLQRLDADAEASWTATFAAMSDTQLQAQVELRHTQFTTHLEAGQWSQALQRVDYYHLITQELSARGLPFPAGYPNTETLFQMYNDARA
jgi:hypothetical protein